MLNYEQIAKEMKNKTLRTIWQELGLQCKFETFKRAVLKYKATGHKTSLRLNGITGQTYMFEDDIKKCKNDADILDTIATEKTWAQLRFDKMSSDVYDKILDDLKTGIDVKNMNPRDALDVFAAVEIFRKKGYCINFDGFATYKLANNIEIKPTVIRKDWSGDKHIT